jgi:hypothetical protein
VIQQSTRRANDNSETFPQFSFFLLRIFATHNSAAEYIVEKFEQLVHFNFDLGAQFSCWTEDDGVRALVSGYFLYFERVFGEMFEQRH